MITVLKTCATTIGAIALAITVAVLLTHDDLVKFVHEQDMRDARQERLLAEVEAVRSPGATELAAAWRKFNRYPTDDQMDRLQNMTLSVTENPKMIRVFYRGPDKRPADIMTIHYQIGG